MQYVYSYFFCLFPLYSHNILILFLFISFFKVIFMRQSNHKERMLMFSDIVLERVLADANILQIPVNERAELLHKIFDVLEELNLLKEGAKDAL